MILVGFMVPSPVSSETGDAGVNSGQFLRLPIGARGPAMGDAMTPIAMGSEAVHYNPAGIVHNRAENMSMSMNRLTQGIRQGDLYYVRPSTGAWTIGIGMKYVDYGFFDQTTIESPGSNIITNDVGTFGANDLSASVTWGYKTAFDYSLGGTVKLVRRSIAGVSASGLAADFGYQAWSQSAGMTWGFAVKNLGSPIQFEKRDERLPRVLRGGIGYQPVPSVMLTVDVEKEQGVGADYLTGVEWEVYDRVFLRGGYNSRSDVSTNLTGGLGLQLPYFTLNYAYQPFNEFGDKHRYGMTFFF